MDTEQPLDTLSYIEGFAMRKVVSEKLAKVMRIGIKPGLHQVDCMVHVKGELKVCADYQQKQVNKLNPWLLVQVLMDKLNGQTLESVVHETLARQVEDDDPDIEDLKLRTQVAAAAMAQSCMQMSKGPTFWEGTVTKVEMVKA